MGLFLSSFMFVLLNFVYSNLNDRVFNYPMIFRFEVPLLPPVQSPPVPMGFVVITSFCLGILFCALLQIIPALFKSVALRSRDRKIRELEQQLAVSQRGAQGPQI